MQSSSAGPKPAVRPARYATGLLREKSSHSAAIREAKSLEAELFRLLDAIFTQANRINL